MKEVTEEEALDLLGLGVMVFYRPISTTAVNFPRCFAARQLLEFDIRHQAAGTRPKLRRYYVEVSDEMEGS